MQVRDVMLTEFATVSPDDSLLKAGNRLLRKRLSSAIVVDKGRVLGLLNKESFVLSIRYMGSKELDKFKVSDMMDKVFNVVSPGEDLKDAVDKLLGVPNRIYRMPVIEDGKLAGVISKSFIVELYAENMRGRFKVRDLMSYEPATVNDYDSIKELIKQINLSKDKKVLVMKGNTVTGIVSVYDLSIALFKIKRKSEDFYAKLTIEDVMTPNPLTIKPGADAAEAAKTMYDNRIGSLPVVNEKLEGIITKTDILKGYHLCMT